MALTLDATLAAVQESQSRRPLCEIMSRPAKADIPFTGDFLTTETFNEYSPNIQAHSSGRLFNVYAYGPDGDDDSGLKYVYTDLDRLEFTTVTIELYSYSNQVVVGVSACELSNGNIGIIALVDDGGDHLYRLLRRVITVTGTAVNNGEIANWSHDTWTGKPYALTITTNSYILIYAKINTTPDPDEFDFYKRTSADFVTWGAETKVSIGGLTASLMLDDPYLHTVATPAGIWLWFGIREQVGTNGEDLWNVSYTISTDSCATWAAATKATAYDTFAEIGYHPTAVQKLANQLYLIFNRKLTALHHDKNSSGWPDHWEASDDAQECSFDPVNRKLYIVNAKTSLGPHYLDNIVRVDVDTWLVDKYWDDATTPGILVNFTGYGAGLQWWWNCNHGDEEFIAWCAKGDYVVQLLDGINDTIKTYHFKDNATYGFTQNTSYTPNEGLVINSTWVDKANRRLYVFFNYGVYLTVGYFDLDDAGPEYAFTTVLDYFATEVANYPGGDQTRFYVWPDADLFGVFAIGATGHCYLFTLSTGAVYKHYWDTTYPGFPYRGIDSPAYLNGRIYGNITYEANYGNSDRRGICEIVLATDSFLYHQPSWASQDDYNFHNAIIMDETRILWCSWYYGLSIYNTADDTWTLYSNDTITDLTDPAGDCCRYMIYDSVGEMLLGAWGGSVDTWGGAIMFSLYGYLRQACYMTGAYSGGTWTWGTTAPLVKGYRDYDAIACPDPGSPAAMYVFWTNETPEGELSIKWSKDGSDFDISPYILAEEEVSRKRSIDGSPHELSFSVSHGHLFDPYNQNSLLSAYLRKGRRLTLRWGESISGVATWQADGTFHVISTSISFERGVMPMAKVAAADARAIWADAYIYVTDNYNAAPDTIIGDLLTTYAGMALADIDLPTFTNSVNVQKQWIETTLDEIINQVCERFGHYFTFDVDGKATARPITNTSSPDHIYTDSTKLFRYSPDDKYSDFTNRVTVTCAEYVKTAVTFNEERVGSLSGTIGWWGFKNDFEVRYSEDNSRRCLGPRLVVVETACSIGFKLAGGISESIAEGSEAGYEDAYCIVTVSAPDLRSLLEELLILWTVAFLIADLAPQAPFGVLPTIPWGRLMEKIAMFGTIMILASTGNYQYEVWAQPKGEVYRTVQSTWNDSDHQTEFGAVIEKKIEDPLCGSVTACAQVAAFEGMVVQLQRRRLMIEKMAHLQDQEGDTLRIPHPISGGNLDVFVCDQIRKFKKGTPGSNDGYFNDEMNVWVIP